MVKNLLATYHQQTEPVVGDYKSKKNRRRNIGMPMRTPRARWLHMHPELDPLVGKAGRVSSSKCARK